MILSRRTDDFADLARLDVSRKGNQLGSALMIRPDQSRAFEDTLLAGRYNLLLGSGISQSSRNRFGRLLRSSDQLRSDLCTLTNAKPSTSLSRVYNLLSAEQRRVEIVDKYSGCEPGSDLPPLKCFVWKRIFTFNVDDVIEQLYVSDAQQRLVSFNYDSDFEPDTTRSDLQCIHLHGFVRQPSSGFVFSPHEYVRVMRSINPWMLLLSQLLATEPFIIAGTSLNEIDLEYYLSHRSPSTPRTGRGPSLLIEPAPDAASEADCTRYDLTLVATSFGEFSTWLGKTYPHPPTVQQLIVPTVANIFSQTPAPHSLLRFFSDFEIVQATVEPKSRVPSSFLYGAEPTWSEISQHLDIERRDNVPLLEWASRWLEHPRRDDRVFAISDPAATGKSTVLKRVAHDLASRGKLVLTVKTVSRIDVDVARSCIALLRAPVILFADALADHVEQIRELLSAEALVEKCAVVGAERHYRQEFVDLLLADIPRTTTPLLPLNVGELEQLLERYLDYGLLAAPDVAINKTRFVKSLRDQPVAIAVCRILNDFRPLDAIVDSLWNASLAEHRSIYLVAALAQHCHWVGVRYSILQAIAGTAVSVSDYLQKRYPLSIALHPNDDDFVVPETSILAERLLSRIARSDRERVLTAFISLADALAPHVNRRAIMQRSPEARLAGRLFDADKVAKPLLGVDTESFYIDVKPNWEWNSRYWEQRALLIAERDITTAIQYARHAVSRERHPLPLTTLGKILLKTMHTVHEHERTAIFGEAFSLLNEAIDLEARNYRVTVHPFLTLLMGAARFIERGGQLTLAQHDTLRRHRNEARYRFGSDSGVQAAVTKLDELL